MSRHSVLLVLVLVLVLSLFACGRDAPVNPGAKILVYLQPTPEIQALYPAYTNLGAITDWNGPCTIVRLPDDARADETVRLTLHEFLTHVMPRLHPETAPACQDLLSRLADPRWDPRPCAIKKP